MNLNEAINFLKKTVNYSNVDGQKRLDTDLIPACEVQVFESAMQVVHKAIYDGEITQEDFNIQVGLSA